LELREELASYPTKADLKAELASYPTKADLKAELASHPTKADLANALDAWAGQLTTLLRGEMLAMEKRLRIDLAADLGAHVRAANEDMQRFMATLDDKYNDLPPRVTKLEAKVFAPKRRRR
jgi:hypothetical protein